MKKRTVERSLASRGEAILNIFQIIMTHNREWTIREIIVFIIIFSIGVIFSCQLLLKKKICWSQALAGLLLILFLGVVFGSTVFTRNANGVHRYKLELFWSWKEVYHGSKELLKENILKMILLFPMGLLLPVIFFKKISWWKGFLAGALVSALIETSQLALCRGLFEWDDIIHNGFGSMLGCLISSAAMNPVDSHRMI